MSKMLCLLGRHRWHGAYHLVANRIGVGARVGMECLRCGERNEWDIEEAEMVEFLADCHPGVSDKGVQVGRLAVTLVERGAPHYRPGKYLSLQWIGRKVYGLHLGARHLPTVSSFTP